MPVRVYIDEGSEFQNSAVESFLASLNVADDEGLREFVERMIRNLEDRLRIPPDLRRALGQAAA